MTPESADLSLQERIEIYELAIRLANHSGNHEAATFWGERQRIACEERAKELGL